MTTHINPGPTPDQCPECKAIIGLLPRLDKLQREVVRKFIVALLGKSRTQSSSAIERPADDFPGYDADCVA